MRRLVERKIITSRLGLALLNLLTLLGVGWFSYQSTVRLLEMVNQEINTQAELSQLKDVLSIITDAETGERGYIITGQERFLEPYNRATSTIGPKLKQLQGMVANEPKQMRRFNALKNLIAQRLTLLRKSIEFRRQKQDVAVQITLTAQGKANHDQIRALIAEMENDEQHKLQLNTKQAAAEVSSTISFLLAGSSLSLVIFLLVYYLLNRQITERQPAQVALHKAKDELDLKALEQTAKLTQANNKLQNELFERKRVEHERAKLIAIVEATPDIVITTSLDKRVHYLNSAARKILGFAEDEDLAKCTISNAQPDWACELVRKEGLPAVMRDGVWVGETAFLSLDGREIPVSQLLIAHKTLDGRVKLISTIARDITQQKQIEATLREAERRWRSLLEDVRLVVVGMDTNGKIEYVNPFFVELVGYTPAEIIGRDWFETFLPPYQRKRVQNNFKEIRSPEFSTHNQNVILTKQGEQKVIAWNNTLLRNLQGDVIGSLSIGEDITERQAIEHKKEEFISVVSHEIRTPLTSIHGALSLLSSNLVDTKSDPGRRVIEIAAQSAERLVRIVNDILELERLDSGKLSLLKQPCDAADLMMKATDMMQVMANQAGITLSVFPQAIKLDADPDRIIQVLTNLLCNAIKFSSRGSTVWLTVKIISPPVSPTPEGTTSVLRPRSAAWLPSRLTPSSPHPSVLFKVEDQGRGIPADKIESIFERFQQVDASDSRKKGGTGLGLAICRSIVQQHGGRLWVESTLGEGSSFYFTLPKQVV